METLVNTWQGLSRTTKLVVIWGAILFTPAMSVAAKLFGFVLGRVNGLGVFAGIVALLIVNRHRIAGLLEQEDEDEDEEQDDFVAW